MARTADPGNMDSICYWVGGLYVAMDLPDFAARAARFAHTCQMSSVDLHKRE